MKRAVKKLMLSLGADRLVRLGYGGLGAILMFHRLQPACAISKLGAASAGDVTPEEFIRMLGFLRDQRIEVVSLDDAIRRMANPVNRRQFVCLTFDDGYRDNYEVLWPIAREHGVPVTIYVTPGFIDRTAPMWWYALDPVIAREESVTLSFIEGEITVPTRTTAEKELAYGRLRRRLLEVSEASRARALASLEKSYGADFEALADSEAMTWEMVRELAATDLVEIGAHTMSHPPLASLEPEEALAEMRQSKTQLEAETGRPVRHFAFPYGDEITTGSRETRLAAEAGFTSATTTRQGAIFPAHAAAPHALPRFTMGADDCPLSLQIKLSGLPVALRRPLRPLVTDPAA